MSRVTRSIPRRSPNHYPVGTTLRLRDGRVFKVDTESHREWYDPTMGYGGGEMRTVETKVWKELGIA